MKPPPNHHLVYYMYYWWYSTWSKSQIWAPQTTLYNSLNNFWSASRLLAIICPTSQVWLYVPFKHPKNRWTIILRTEWWCLKSTQKETSCPQTTKLPPPKCPNSRGCQRWRTCASIQNIWRLQIGKSAKVSVWRILFTSTYFDTLYVYPMSAYI